MFEANVSSPPVVSAPSVEANDYTPLSQNDSPTQKFDKGDSEIGEGEFPYVIPAKDRQVFVDLMAGSHDIARPYPLHALTALAEAHPEAWAELAATFLDTGIERARRRAGDILVAAALNIEDDATRARWVRRLTLQLEEEPSQSVVSAMPRRLLRFSPMDFDAASRAVLRRLAYSESPMGGIPRLVGVIGIEDLRPRLEELAGPPDSPSTRIRHEAQLALARMGDKGRLAEFLDKHAQEPDQFARLNRRLEDLAFTRQEEAIERIRDTLMSDDRLPPVDKDSDMMQIDEEWKYALDNLAKMELPGFPVSSEVWVGGYSDSDRDRSRAWMRRDENWRR